MRSRTITGLLLFGVLTIASGCSEDTPADPQLDRFLRAYELLLPAAEPGETDIETAERLAEAGSAEGRFIAGYIYITGNGVPQNLQRGTALMEQVAATEHHYLSVDASRYLARTYDQGVLGSNIAAAIAHYERVAASGDIEAMVQAAVRLGPRGEEYTQEVVEERIDRMFEGSTYIDAPTYYAWIEQANSSDISFVLYPDYSEACTVRRRMRDPLAVVTEGSGDAFEEDGWAAIDLFRSYAWYSVAATKGDRRGRMARDELAAYCMRPQQVATAQDLSAELFSVVSSAPTGSSD